MAKPSDDGPESESFQVSKRHQRLLADLPIFYTIVKFGGLEQAAAALGYRRPAALSNRMKRLENELGAPVFEGHSRLTPMGTALSEVAARVIPQVENFIRQCGANAEALRIAAVTSVWQTYRKQLMEISASRAAGWKIFDADVRFINHTAESIELIENGTVDIGFITYAPKSSLPRGLAMRPKAWKMERMVMVVSRKNRDLNISRSDHKWGEPSLFNKYGAVMMAKGYGIRDRSVDPYLATAGIELSNIVAELGTVAEVKDLVARTPEFITILPQPTVEADERLFWSDLTGIESRPVSFIYRKPPSKRVKSFLKSVS